MRSLEPPAQWQPLINVYLEYLALEKRQASNSVLAVSRDLAHLTVHPLEATPAHLKTLLAKRHAAGAAPRSLARLASSLRGFFAHLVQQGLRTSNPAEGIKTPKIPKSLPKALGVDELGGLLRPFDVADFQLRQARFLIEFLYATGLRISEAMSIALLTSESVSGRGGSSAESYLDLAQGEIRVVGKGSKARVVPIMQALLPAIQAHMDARQKHLHSCTSEVPHSALFVSARGGRLSVRQAQLDVARFAKLAGLQQHLHPHMLRHSFGSHVLQMSQNLRAVQELLGHSSIASTQIYTSLDFSHLAQVYDSAFPRALKREGAGESDMDLFSS